MSTEPERAYRLADHGHWEGNLFHFDPPIILPDGKVMRVIDLAGAELGEGITGEDVIHVLLNPMEGEGRR